MFNDRIINEVVRRVLLEAKADAIISEEQNPAYSHTKANSAKKDSIGELWRVIERKQEELQGMVFGELGSTLTDITAEKAKSMGNEHLRVPNTICNAGNSKLPPSVLIVNMSSSLMCPSFYLGICTITEGRCYAQQGENQHSNSVLPNRWQTDLMHTQMLQQYKSGNREPMKKYFSLVEMYIQLGNAYAAKLARNAVSDVENRERRKLSKEEKRVIRSVFNRYKISDVRLNETGDFHCQLAVDLWSKFADKIKRKYGISTHAYTARNLDFSDASKHMSINASHSGINMGDEPERRFRAVPEDFYNSLTEGTEVKDRQPILGYNGHVFFYKCPCGNDESMCDRCGVCFDRNRTGRPYTIFVKYHGMKKANGLKHLFTKSEVEGVMDKLYKNGWVTDDEYRSWASEKNQRFLDDLSGKIGKMRSRSMDMLNEIKDLMCRIDKGYSDYVMLTEGLSDKLYHFTSIGNAFEICKNDVLYLQSAYAKDADNYDGKRKFYLSCTRMPNVRHGYSRKFMHGGVRIVLDGRRLSNDFKGKPINYWKGLGDKYSFYEHLPMSYEQTKLNNDYNIRKFKEQNPGATDDDVAKYLQKNFSDSNQYHIGNESEDRIFSYKSTIENAHDYIVSIDVLLPNLYSSKDELSVAYGFLGTMLGSRVHIYGDVKSFNAINGKDANEWVYDNHDYNGIAYNGSRQMNGRYKTVLMDLVKFISFGNPEFEGDRFGGAVANLLKRYGLSKYTNLIGQIQKDMRYSSLRDVASSLEGNRRDISDSPNADTAKIAQMMTDYFREIGADTFHQAYKIKEDMLKDDKGVDWHEIDGNITKPLLVFNNYTVIPYPEREKFIDVLKLTNYGDVQSLADSLAYEIMDYKDYAGDGGYRTSSKNVNSMYNYLSKLFRKGTIQQVLDVFRQIGVTNDFLSTFNIDFQTQDLNYFDASMKKTLSSRLKERTSDDYRAISRANDKELAPLFKKGQ